MFTIQGNTFSEDEKSTKNAFCMYDVCLSMSGTLLIFWILTLLL